MPVVDDGYVKLPSGEIVAIPPGGQGFVTTPSGEVRSPTAAVHMCLCVHVFMQGSRTCVCEFMFLCKVLWDGAILL